MRSRHTPMLYMVLPLICGVVLSRLIEWSLLLALILIAPSLLLLLIYRSRILIYPLLVGFGLLISSLNSSDRITKPLYSQQVLVVTGDDRTCEVIALRSAESHAWQRVHLKLILSLDQASEVQSHSALMGRGNIYPIGSDGSNTYLSSLSRKGIVGVLSLGEFSIVDPSSVGLRQPLTTRINSWAMGRLERLDLPPTTFASAAAMGLARRESLGEELKVAYRKSGTSHILALSGLHFGVVLLIISSITYLLPLLRNGHIFADLIAIVAIWLFALMAGAGESVLRAAWMFSLLHLASLTSKRYNSLNSLLSAATLIILFDPAALFDIGFQLSFIAVLAIIMVGVPLSFRAEQPSKMLTTLLSATIIGFIASTSTMPLAAYTFGGLSLFGSVATLPLLVTLTIVVITTTLWIIAPLPLLAPVASTILEVTITIQNWIVTQVASWNWGYFDLLISWQQMVLCYAILIAIFWLLRRWSVMG